LKNDNEVYFAADRPYGLIEATVLRDGVEPKIPVDMTNL
ncbi:urate oxidase, partial [Streptomyces sp. SID8455]|nr:urate oxidase [Streptomyces sp. SID8455]